MRTISEQEFTFNLEIKLNCLSYIGLKSVSGPGRSGAIASVYASHYLRIPFIPYGQRVPEHLQPHLVIDTATASGKTLRKAMKKMNAYTSIAVYNEPPRVKFWYEYV